MLNVAKNRHLISFLVTENSAEFVTFSEIGQISDLNISQFYLSSTNIWIFSAGTYQAISYWTRARAALWSRNDRIQRKGS